MNLYPIVTTPNPTDCRDFYQKALDARVLFQAHWYVHLAVGKSEIGFLLPNPPVRLPVFQHATLARGLSFAVETDDVRWMFRHLTELGIEPLGKLEQFPTGEWAFSVMDPAGLVLTFVERDKPAGGEIVEV
jgi:catechol 2,3-dioxygenase-like lactoylglutathione lyase family enzyme